MRGTGSASSKSFNPRTQDRWELPALLSSRASLLLFGLILLSSGCSQPPPVPVRPVQIQQNWELQPGKRIGSHRVAGGLGDISIDVGGDRVYAPFDGVLQPNDLAGCYIFSSPDVPAYLFRFCGLNQPKLGQVRRGENIGSAQQLQFAALRRQPDGKWTMVEPASDVLERALKPQ